MRSIGVSCIDTIGKTRAVCEEALGRSAGRRRAGAIVACKALVACVKRSRQSLAAIGGAGLCLDQRLHALAPGSSVFLSAQGAQVMKSSQDFRELEDIGLIRRRRILRTGGRHGGEKDEGDGKKKTLAHDDREVQD